MVRYLLCMLATSIYFVSSGQTTLFSDDMESLTSTWIRTEDTSPNFWLDNTCAGNGTSNAGTKSLYISSGGSVSGCGPTGTEQFAYTNAPTGLTNSALIYETIDGTCASAYQVTFDYRIDGVIGEDFANLVYSTDAGATWTVVGGEIPSSTAWTTTTISLPSILDGTSFQLGFRFTYNDNTITGLPFAFDNVLVTGADLENPIITCPTSLDLFVDNSCQAIVDDNTKDLLTLSDNCTDSALILVTQSIPEFTVLATGPGGTETIILTATDEAGNTAQCPITLNIIDLEIPVPVCPTTQQIYVDGNCQGTTPDYTGLISVTDNCSASAAITLSQSPPTGTVITGAIVETTITITATDESGNIGTCDFIMRTLDTIPTQITCPADSNLYVDASCMGILGDYTSSATIVDNCEPLSNLTVTQSPPVGTTVSADQVITLTVNGGVPAIPQTCTFTTVLVDSISPSITCPTGSILHVDNTCTTSLLDYTSGGIIIENCGGGSTITQSPIPGTILGANPSEQITLTVTDNSGNQGQCQFTVSIVDTISPTATCPASQQENGDLNCFATLGDYTSLVTPLDNCTSGANFTISQSPPIGNSFSGTQTVTMTIEDENANTTTCAFDVTIVDITAPVINCPSNSTVSTTTLCNYDLADFTTSVIVTDNCDNAPIVTQSPASGTPLSVGVHTITLIATDASNNSANCTFDITVEDQVAPIFTTCASTQNLIVDGTCQGTLGDYTALASVTDNCSSPTNITITQSPVSGTIISATALITLTATDEAGNTSNCQFNATLSDTTPPVITVCPSNFTTPIGSNCEYTIPDIMNSIVGTDNCSSLTNMTLTQTPAIGTPANGTTPVLIVLSDESGNQTTCVTTIIPDDVSPPTIICPTAMIENIGTNCDFNLGYYGSAANVTDNCSNYVINQTPAIGSLITTGMNEITLEVVDAGGNSETCSFFLDVVENVDPIINCPNDTTSCDPVMFYNLPTFSDNCFSFLTQIDVTGYTVGSTFPVGVTFLQYMVADSSGNSQQCTFRVEILDYPSSANIPLDSIVLCDQNSTLLEADAITSGTGEWSLISGQGNFNNEFASTTGVNNLGYETNSFEWAVSSASCGTLSDTIVVISAQSPLPTSIVNDTLYTCFDSTIALEATAPIYGTGIWTTNNNSVISDSSQNITSAIIHENGWHEFTWTVSNGSCPLTSDSIQVYFSNPINASASDSAVCLEDGSVVVTADPLAPDQSCYWSIGSGSATIYSQDTPTSDIDNFGNGINTFIYEINSPGCPTARDTIVILASLCNGFNPIIPTMITPNFDGKNDIFEIDFLNKVYPNCQVTIFNRWGSVVFESTGYSSPWDGTRNNEKLPMGTYFYKINLNDNDGTTLNGDISIIY
ncbi:MAG: HYR domain-containing protein [Crocinitomicaceae bacterium]|nr:HYR domain-containing protein [Crocinitomicaceae bacterium]